MAATPSTMMALGTIAPDFSLLDTVSDKEVSLSELKGELGTLVMFICNHCPYVLHIQDEIVNVANEYSKQGVGFVAISSNDVVNYPNKKTKKMKVHANNYKFSFPYLYDESQDIAKAYDAACTPDLFLFDKDLKCVYRGQFDGSRPKNDLPVTGKDLRQALDALVSGQPVKSEQIPSIGCNIKWKS